MSLSITSVLILSLALTCMAAPAPSGTQPDNVMLRALINPPLDSNIPSTPTAAATATATATAINNNDNMIGDLVQAAEQRPVKSIKALKDALTASVKSQLMTSLAAMTPEQVSVVTGGAAANSNQLSQLNLMGGINNLVSLIVRKILESLLPRIFGQSSNPGTGIFYPSAGSYPSTGGYNPIPQQGGGMFGSSMNPMSMMVPGMMFGLVNKMFDFI